MKYQMRKAEIPYTEVRVDQNDTVLASFNAAGITSVPVVMVHRTEDDEVPDVILGFHSEFVNWLKDPSIPIDEYLTV